MHLSIKSSLCDCVSLNKRCQLPTDHVIFFCFLHKGPWKAKYFMMWKELNTAQQSSCLWFQKMSLRCVSWTEKNMLKDTIFASITFRITVKYSYKYSLQYLLISTQILRACYFKWNQIFSFCFPCYRRLVLWLLDCLTWSPRVMLAGKQGPGRVPTPNMS